MKKKFTAIVALLLVVVMLFASCGASTGDNTDSSTTKKSHTSKHETTESTTETTTTKYSKDDKLIALTYDDGPGTKSSKKIVDVLKANNANATFFVNGYQLVENKAITKEAFDNGNEIGNHTYDHKYLTKLSADEVKNQVQKNNDLIKEVTGAECKLFRCPGGLSNGIEDLIGMPMIGWSIDTNDWRKKDASHQGRSEAQRNKEINKMVNHVVDNAYPGAIVLMHEIYNFTADASEILIPKLIAEGYTLCTVSEMFEAYGVTLEAGKTYHDAKPVAPSSGVGGVVQAGTYIVSTNSDSLNVRAEASADARLLGTIPKGGEVTVTESVDGWAKINFGEISGWVSTKYLSPKN